MTTPKQGIRVRDEIWRPFTAEAKGLGLHPGNVIEALILHWRGCTAKQRQELMRQRMRFLENQAPGQRPPR